MFDTKHTKEKRWATCSWRRLLSFEAGHRSTEPMFLSIACVILRDRAKVCGFSFIIRLVCSLAQCELFRDICSCSRTFLAPIAPYANERYCLFLLLFCGVLALTSSCLLWSRDFFFQYTRGVLARGFGCHYLAYINYALFVLPRLC